MPKRAALIKDGQVVNVIFVADDWPDTKDPKDRFELAPGHTVVVADDAEMFDIYDGQRFTRGEGPPPAVPARPVRPLTANEVEQLRTLLQREP